MKWSDNRAIISEGTNVEIPEPSCPSHTTSGATDYVVMRGLHGIKVNPLKRCELSLGRLAE